MSAPSPVCTHCRAPGQLKKCGGVIKHRAFFPLSFPHASDLSPLPSYCSPACKRLHWAAHMAECKAIVAAAATEAAALAAAAAAAVEAEKKGGKSSRRKPLKKAQAEEKARRKELRREVELRECALCRRLEPAEEKFKRVANARRSASEPSFSLLCRCLEPDACIPFAGSLLQQGAPAGALGAAQRGRLRGGCHKGLQGDDQKLVDVLVELPVLRKNVANAKQGSLAQLDARVQLADFLQDAAILNGMATASNLTDMQESAALWEEALLSNHLEAEYIPGVIYRLALCLFTQSGMLLAKGEAEEPWPAGEQMPCQPAEMCGSSGR